MNRAVADFCLRISQPTKDYRVFNREAQQVVEQILKDAPVGTEIFFNDDEDATPHYNDLRSDKGLHVDGWKAVKRGPGDIKVAKKWASY